MSRPMWFVKLVRLGFPHRFLGARLTRLPLLGRLSDRMLFEGDELVILPPAAVLPVGEEVGGEEASAVLPDELVHRLIDQAGFLWVMDSCICRQATGCEDYPADLGCLFMGQAARDINPMLGRRVSRDEAHAHIHHAREHGLFHLVGRNRLDTVWLGVGPGDHLLTVCNCCPCCCLWTMLPNLERGIGDKLERLPGLKVEVTDRCLGCGTCVEGPCLAGAISLEGGRAVISEACRGCGHCAHVCPEGAIEVTLPGGGYVDELVRRMSGLVDVR
ncbi:MAG: 4Fe-4S binding protein [Actinobacteria bacterium]|nr:4Fe-4S binding protein [Actinomycetota bacterium]MBU1942794.1 4Fe-4S binding protein [Actinomycetota bacterium]MBU2686116.1 4Fe-4S binding protein [Actinomycetota bacterium]